MAVWGYGALENDDAAEWIADWKYPEIPAMNAFTVDTNTLGDTSDDWVSNVPLVRIKQMFDRPTPTYFHRIRAAAWILARHQEAWPLVTRTPILLTIQALKFQGKALLEQIRNDRTWVEEQIQLYSGLGELGHNVMMWEEAITNQISELNEAYPELNPRYAAQQAEDRRREEEVARDAAAAQPALDPNGNPDLARPIVVGDRLEMRGTDGVVRTARVTNIDNPHEIRVGEATVGDDGALHQEMVTPDGRLVDTIVEKEPRIERGRVQMPEEQEDEIPF